MSAIRTISRLHSRVETLEKEREHLLDAAKDVIASASDTYKKRNGHLASFEDDSGDKCWIVPFDAFESLRSAVDTPEAIGGDHG